MSPILPSVPLSRLPNKIPIKGKCSCSNGVTIVYTHTNACNKNSKFEDHVENIQHKNYIIYTHTSLGIFKMPLATHNEPF